MDGLMSLISSTEYAGFTIKEWNIVQFSKLSSVISEVAKEYKAKNLSWDDFSQSLAVDATGGMMDLSQGVLDMLEPFTTRAELILTVSCNIDAKKLAELPFTDGVVLLLLILKTNMEHLTRFFVQLVERTNNAATTGSTQP